MTSIPQSMKAAVLVHQREPLQVADVELPRALDVGQVLVKVGFSGICGSQIGEIDGVKGDDPYLPHLLGHEGSGTVLAMGPGVKTVAQGDTVVLHWRKGTGLEGPPPKYRWQGATVNAGWITTFNEYAIVSENRVTAIAADSDPRIAALFGCAVTTGFGVIINNARLKIGESVVIFGAGGVGLNIVQAAALVTAHPIIAVDLYDHKLELARSMGATHVVNASRGDARSAIEEVLDGGALDVFIDNTGIPDIIEMGYEMTSATGRVILVGVPRKGRKTSLFSLPLHFGKVITGSHGGEAVPEVDIPRYLNLHEAGRIKLDGLITDEFPLRDINDAIAGVRDGSIAGRCLIKM